MVGLITDWLEHAEKQTQENGVSIPAWLQEKQQAAMNKMQTFSAPSRRLESWRYADVSRINKELDCFQSTHHSEVINEPESNDTVVIVVDESGYTGIGDRPDWLVIQSLDEMSPGDWHEFDFDQESVVSLANDLLVHTGGLINIKKTNQPVNVHIVYAFDEIDTWQYIRNQFLLAHGAEVNITEQHQSGRINVVNVYDLADDVELNRQQNISLNSSQQFISYNLFEISENASVINMNQHIGGSLQHHCHSVNFNKTGSKYQSGSINKTYDNNHITDIVNVNHNYENNQSDVTHRSIAKDQSQIFNNAKALVAVGADQSEIEQDLKNVLLSPDAKIFSKPELEVYADEVVAAHGSTIGALDETALFYLRSRGVDIEQAREIMIESFEQEAWVC